MAGVSKIYYSGKEILYIDYRDQREDKMIQIILEAKEIILNDNKEHLQLSNFNKSFATSNFMKVANEFGKETKHLTKKGAILGITGAKKVLLKGYNALTGGILKPFDEEEEAKKYLVNE